MKLIKIFKKSEYGSNSELLIRHLKYVKERRKNDNDNKTTS